MRIIIDTNVLLSGLFWFGAPHQLLKHARNGDIELIISHTMLEELIDTLQKPKFLSIIQRNELSIDSIINELQILIETVIATPLPQPVCRDQDDDIVLACALAADSRLIVTGDKDLLVLHPWQQIDILNPSDALLRIGISN